MAQKVTLGGDRLGSGEKQQVELHNYMMNSFNLSQDFKSSISPGVLYPFLKLVGTNHGTFDIDLDSIVRTLPTVGPLFGSFKLQADLFMVPFRLYQGILHNNPISLGMNMNQVYIPKINVSTKDGTGAPTVKGSNFYNRQVDESALLKYMGVSGIGTKRVVGEAEISRKINAIPFLAYYDIFKCYYSNKQEEYAYVITPTNIQRTTSSNIEEVIIESLGINAGEGESIDLNNFTTNPSAALLMKIKGTDLNKEILIKLYDGNTIENSKSINDIVGDECGRVVSESDTEIVLSVKIWELASQPIQNLLMVVENGEDDTHPQVKADIALTPFKLSNIDDMRNLILSSNTLGSEFVISEGQNDMLPYGALVKTTFEGLTWNAFVQNGLVVKTYQSDLFNNWLDTEFIDGQNGVSAITAIDTSEGSFTMDSLNLAEKLYELLNRILVKGGTYQDWQEAVYGEGAIRMCETPVYLGGMSSEVMFEEVISNNESNVNGNYMPLGSLGGKGTQVGKKGGNNIHVTCDEPCYIIGMLSITPRICYTQGNDWDMTELDSIDDLHKPQLDGIGFQDLLVEQFAWWNTQISGSTITNRDAAGKQIAWINYQTAVDKAFGDFAKTDGLGFMALSRHYEHGNLTQDWNTVKDITTYIDPIKYNYAFADANLSAQNFWVQIYSKITARRKMGAQQIPNL